MNKTIIDVSVIMPCYNASSLIEEAIESILNGSCLPKEIILINDCSTDHTLNVLEQLKIKYIGIKIINNPDNIGAFKSRGIAVEVATSPYVCIIDSDDYLEYDSLWLAYSDLIDHNAQISLFNIYVSSFDKQTIHKMFHNSLSTTSAYTGKEACLLTLNGWKIGGFGIFDRNLYSVSSKKILIDVMNADELLLREVFLSAQKVIQSSGKYFYRTNEHSITRSINYKHLGLMESNLYLLNFAIEHQLNSYKIRKNLINGGIKETYKILKYKNFFLKHISVEHFFETIIQYGPKAYLHKLSFFEWLMNFRYFIKGSYLFFKILLLKDIMKRRK